MILHDLRSMTGGWFIGEFAPTCFATKDFEVAVKRYPVGIKEAPHVHKVGREFTLVLEGRVRVNGQELGADTIFEIPPGEATAFETLTEVVTVVVKVPCVAGDKYLVEGDHS